VVRVGAAVVAMEVAALVLATLVFGWVALVVGAPALLATVVVFVALWVSRAPMRRLQERRAARFEPDGPPQGGLMSGFFEVPAAR
jgi:Flp pilus assembly protein TadB